MNPPELLDDHCTPVSRFEKMIIEVVANRYQGSSYSFFFGSSLNNEDRKSSDIDLFVIYETPIHSFREKFVAEGELFDVFIYDSETLNGTLHMARQNGNFFPVDAVLNSVILPAPTPQARQLQTVAQRIKDAGYIFNDRNFVRQYVTSILDDLVDDVNVEERNMLCVELYKCVVSIVLIKNGAGVCSRKYASRALNSIDSTMQRRLDTALSEALLGKTEQLTSIANDTLLTIGGILREGFRMPCQEAIRMPLPVI